MVNWRSNELISCIRPLRVRSKPRAYGGLIQPIKTDLQTNNPFDLINLQQGLFEKQVQQTPPWGRANLEGVKMSVRDCPPDCALHDLPGSEVKGSGLDLGQRIQRIHNAIRTMNTAK